MDVCPVTTKALYVCVCGMIQGTHNQNYATGTHSETLRGGRSYDISQIQGTYMESLPLYNIVEIRAIPQDKTVLEEDVKGS